MENNFEKKANRRNEIISLFIIAGAIFLAVVLWIPAVKTGVLGKFFWNVVHGFFGTLGTLLPLFILIIAIDRLLTKKEKISSARKNCLILLFLAITIFVSVMYMDVDKVYRVTAEGNKSSVFKAIQVFWESGMEASLVSTSSLWTGGLIGGLLGFSLMVVTGKVGSLIIMLAMILALIIVVFNVSYTQYLEKSAEMIQQTRLKLEEKRRRRLEEKEEAKRLAEEEAARLELEAVELASKSAEDAGDTSDTLTEEKEYELYEEGFDFDLTTNQALHKGNTVSTEWLKKELAKERNVEYEEPFQIDFNMPDGSWKSSTEADWDEADYPQIPGFEPLTKDSDSLQVGAEEALMPDQSERENNLDLKDNIPSISNSPDKKEMLSDLEEAPASQAISAEQVRDSTSHTLDDEQSLRDRQIEEADIELVEEQGRAHWEDRSDGVNKPNYKISSGKKKQIAITDRYIAPDLKLLNPEKKMAQDEDNIKYIQDLGVRLEETLNAFGVDAKVVNYTTGPTITRFELTPGPGVKVSKITNLSDDIALALAAIGVRIEAPIPGKSAIGIEIPNKETQPVLLSGIINSKAFKENDSQLTAGLGRDIQGNEILCDLAKMPHLLIAGATGSGKSVCINSIIISLLYRSGPQDLKMIMIDPKVVELNVYNGIPHLLLPVVTDPKKAYGALNWAITEMEDRYKKFAENSVRDFAGYNQLIKSGHVEAEKLPMIVIIIDELSDLMMTTPKEVEDAISRLTAMARAAGIHLIIATQRPSVDVITGVIKANIPSRIAFTVASQVDSRTILDMGGAEKLLGKGDMLYYPQSASKPLRGQGAFVTDGEVERVIRYLKEYYETDYDESVQKAIENAANKGATGLSTSSDGEEEEDELLEDALQLIVESDYASISLLQRRLSVGYPRAARIIDRLHELGYVGPPEGSKPRTVLITMDQYMKRFEDEE